MSFHWWEIAACMQSLVNDRQFDGDEQIRCGEVANVKIDGILE